MSGCCICRKKLTAFLLSGTERIQLLCCISVAMARSPLSCCVAAKAVRGLLLCCAPSVGWRSESKWRNRVRELSEAELGFQLCINFKASLKPDFELFCSLPWLLHCTKDVFQICYSLLKSPVSHF